MRRRREQRRWLGRWAVLLAVVLAAAVLGLAAPAHAAAPADPPKTFFDDIRNDTFGHIKTAVDTANELAEHNLGEAVDQLGEIVKPGGNILNSKTIKALDNVISADRISQITQRAGKYAAFLDYLLKAVDFGKIAYQIGTAGTKAEFTAAFSKFVRQAITVAAAALGSKGGAAAGALAGGGILSILTGAAGGYLGGKGAEYLAGLLYDEFLNDWIKNGIASQLWSYLNPGAADAEGPGTRAPPGLDDVITGPPEIGPDIQDRLSEFDSELAENLGTRWREALADLRTREQSLTGPQWTGAGPAAGTPPAGVAAPGATPTLDSARQELDEKEKVLLRGMGP